MGPDGNHHSNLLINGIVRGTTAPRGWSGGRGQALFSWPKTPNARGQVCRPNYVLQPTWVPRYPGSVWGRTGRERSGHQQKRPEDTSPSVPSSTPLPNCYLLLLWSRISPALPGLAGSPLTGDTEETQCPPRSCVSSLLIARGDLTKPPSLLQLHICTAAPRSIARRR